jgi:hypothetical protein
MSVLYNILSAIVNHNQFYLDIMDPESYGVYYGIVFLYIHYLINCLTWIKKKKIVS